MDILATAKQLDAYRETLLARQTSGDLVAVSQVKHAEAGIDRDGTLWITGSTLRDWIQFNLNILGKAPRNARTAKLVAGARHRDFMPGFLDYAQLVTKFSDQHKVKRVVGHSLGAAAAQIIGRAYQLPTLAFAAPQVLRRQKRNNQTLRLPGEAMVLNIVWREDLITSVFSGAGKRNIGHVYQLKQILDGPEHTMATYIQALEADQAAPNPQLPFQSWTPATRPQPRPNFPQPRPLMA